MDASHSLDGGRRSTDDHSGWWQTVWRGGSVGVRVTVSSGVSLAGASLVGMLDAFDLLQPGAKAVIVLSTEGSHKPTDLNGSIINSDLSRYT